MNLRNLSPRRFLQVVITCILCLASSGVLASPQVTGDPEFAVVDAYVTARMKDPRIPGAAIVTHIGMPLMLDVILILTLLLVVPNFMHTLLNFLRYFAPDIFWLTIAVVTIPFARDILKGLLTFRMLRTISSSRTSFSAA